MASLVVRPGRAGAGSCPVRRANIAGTRREVSKERNQYMQEIIRMLSTLLLFPVLSGPVLAAQMITAKSYTGWDWYVNPCLRKM